VHYTPTAPGQENDVRLAIAWRRKCERVDRTEFGASEHNREEHGTTKADDEISEVPSSKFAFSPRSQPKNTAIGV
jgi:hypothetical protein